ncbi:glycosyltransferase [Bradyrhizobium sp.]|uniref:glycosyltransferase n=1 Tax=Bradyrhizobium sp. TaxID=376 RepID=UPI001DF9ED54|nr:glycosyltransferase [Bradyrhizobium sp.]MBI5321093.1 glycosyltransferase [Bradyrhizobium sp.]
MSFHPLTQQFATGIETVRGAASFYFDAANLRKLPLVAGIRELRAIRTEKLVIAVEGDVTAALVGPLSIAASLTRARSIEIIWPDLRVEPLRRWLVVRQLARVVYDTLASRLSLLRARRRAAAILASEMPRNVPPAAGSRILFLDANISLGLPVGGSIGHTAGVIDGFIDCGFEVDYASVKDIPTARPGAQGLKLRPESLLAIPPELNFYRYAQCIDRELLSMHMAKPWSFIYQRFSLHNFSGADLGRKLNIPVVLEFNGSEAWTAANWGTRLVLHDAAIVAETAALSSADLLVTVSDELAHDLRRRGIPDRRIVVYPNCVDSNAFDSRRFATEELANLRKSYGIEEDALVVGFIGTFGQWHGVEFLAECIGDLVRDDRDWLEHGKIHFLLVGDGLKMPVVRELLGSSQISRFATLTGLVPQSEAARYLASADILVSPHVPNKDGSRFFGSPTKLFEYMAMEKPIIAAALGQIEGVVSGRGASELGELPPGAGEPCGFLFEPGNARDFKKVLKQVVENKPAAIRAARAARREVLSRYTWKQHVNAILAAMSKNGLLLRKRDVP